MPTGAMIGCTTVMGGLTSWATGGDFWQGAVNGLTIGALNHKIHERILYDRELKKIYEAYIQTSWENGEIVSAKELCKRIGGDFFDSIAEDVENSCAIRLSVALNCSGYEIPNLPGTHQGGDGKFYFIRASDINIFLNDRFKRIATISNPNKIKNGIIFETPGTSWINLGMLM